MISDTNRSEFEDLGRHGVRRLIQGGLYQTEKQKQAYEWLEQREHGAARSLAKEQMSIAHDAKDAAGAAARAAKNANTRATIALVIAAISALAAIAAVIAPYFWRPL